MHLTEDEFEFIESLDDDEFDEFISTLNEDELKYLYEYSFNPMKVFRAAGSRLRIGASTINSAAKRYGTKAISTLNKAGQKYGSNLTGKVSKAGKVSKRAHPMGQRRPTYARPTHPQGRGVSVSKSTNKLRNIRAHATDVKAMGGSAPKTPKFKPVVARGSAPKVGLGTRAKAFSLKHDIGGKLSRNKGKIAGGLAAAGGVALGAAALSKMRQAKQRQQER